MPYKGLIRVRPLSSVMPSVRAIVKPPLAHMRPTAIGARAFFKT